MERKGLFADSLPNYRSLRHGLSQSLQETSTDSEVLHPMGQYRKHVGYDLINMLCISCIHAYQLQEPDRLHIWGSTKATLAHMYMQQSILQLCTEL